MSQKCAQCKQSARNCGARLAGKKRGTEAALSPPGQKEGVETRVALRTDHGCSGCKYCASYDNIAYFWSCENWTGGVVC